MQLFCIGDKNARVGGEIEPPHMLWSYKRRGFRNEDGYDASAGDIYNFMLGVMEFENKTQVSFCWMCAVMLVCPC